LHRGVIGNEKVCNIKVLSVQYGARCGTRFSFP
jgi:hypothetical protein